MYISRAIVDGLRILAFDKETIKKVSREKSLEEIFLSTLFLNYFIVLIVFILGAAIGDIRISGRELNMPVFFGLLMIYPFMYNIGIYLVYGLFGSVAELLNKSKHVKPIISVGFHTAIVYGVIFYMIGLLSTFDVNYGLFLLAIFCLYFLLTMFLAISTVHGFSTGQTLIIIFVPLLIIFTILLFVVTFVDLGYLVGLFY